MEFRDNRQTVDTSHPSVHLTFSTSNSKDVVVRDVISRNDVTCMLHTNITGTDELKIGYVALSKATIPVSWWNVRSTSRYVVRVRFLDNTGDITTAVAIPVANRDVTYFVEPNYQIFGGASRLSYEAYHNDEENLLWRWTTAAGAVFLGPSPFRLRDQTGSPGTPLWLTYREVMNDVNVVIRDVDTGGGVMAYAYVDIYSNDQIEANFPQINERDRLVNLLGMRSECAGSTVYQLCSPAAYAALQPLNDAQRQALDLVGLNFMRVWNYEDAGGNPAVDIYTSTVGIPDFNPVKMIRILTDIPQNTPQTSALFPNPVEVVPTSANMGDWITYEATTPFQLQVPGINIMSLRIRLLDQDGQDINFRGKDWFFSIHVHFVSRNLAPPVGGLVRPMRNNPHPLAKRSRTTYFEPQEETVEEDMLPDRRKLLLGANIPRNRDERAGRNVASQSM